VVVAMKNGEIHRNGIYTLAICCGAMNCHIKAPSMSSFKFSFWGDRQTVATWE